MSERTGLGPLELAVLRSVSATAGPAGRHALTTTMLEHLEVVEGIGPAYGLTVAADLGSSWRVHLCLLDLEGNWGSVGGAPPADPGYTHVRLSPLGELALACEERRVGPVPIGLVDGSLYRGGRAPPLDPARALRTLTALLEDDTLPDADLAAMIALPSLPTGGTVHGDLAGLYAGRSARLLQSCAITGEQDPGGQLLVITGTPLGVAVEQISRNLMDRAQSEKLMEQRRLGHDPDHEFQVRGLEAPNWVATLPSPIGLKDVRDETSGRGSRVVVVAEAGADLDALQGWVRGVWPVTVQTSCRFTGGIGAVLRTWAGACRVDRSGLDKLTELTS